MSNSNLLVNLTFTANTQQARAQMRELETAMRNLNTMVINARGMDQFTSEMKAGYDAAVQLKAALQKATDVQTGKLDLSSLVRSLSLVEDNLGDIREKMLALGPEGRQAFNAMAQSILNAEIPLKKTNTAIDKLWSSFKNVVNYQLSTKGVQLFSQAISEGFRFAQDLNNALNDIRIVSGKSADEMKRFAEQANYAAKQLSTTTTEFTKASLIYFQQGLDDAEVMQRTETTIKMANIVGESVESVSDQLTAVWNNFYDGSKSIEYYADVMTALGAATASSTDEIAQGLEKFAAIAETVGLSYEYATAALATVTAETRQSADVVGTAFKTLFSRLQDLEMGDTLEDGTTLGKYSEALDAVGINIKDASGQLKDMDDILDEMGDKWKTLSKDAQVALAQTVGGTRQYSQLIALMDNWESFEKNLSTATNAEGTLQEQADIYAESWEAAQKRVKASAEAIYKELINDDFFIDLTNGLSSFLDLLKGAIDGVGGLSGVLSTVAMLIPKIFGDKILNSVERFAMGFNGVNSKYMQEQGIALKLETAETLQAEAEGSDSATGLARGTAAKQEAELLENIYNIKTRITAQDEVQLQTMMEEVKVRREAVFAAAEELDTVTDLIAARQQQLDAVNRELAQYEGRTDLSPAEEQRRNDLLRQRTQIQSEIDNLRARENQLLKGVGDAQEDLNKKVEEYKKKLQGLNNRSATFGEIVMSLGKGISAISMGISAITNISKIMNDENLSSWEKFGRVLTAVLTAITALFTVVKAVGEVFKKQTLMTVMDTVARLANAAATKLQAKAQDDLNKKRGKAPKSSENLSDAWTNMKGSFANLGQSLGAVLGKVGAIAAAIAIVALTIAGVVAWINKAENDAKKAEAQATLLAEQYTAIRQAYDEMISTMSNYDEAVKGLDELTEGTVAYREQLMKANEEAMKLIENYDNLQYSVNAQGLIEIDEKSLEAAKAEELDQLARVQSGAAMTSLAAGGARRNAELVDMSRDIKGNGGFWTVLGNAGGAAAAGAGAGALTGAALSSWSGPWALVGAAIGAGVGAISGAVTTAINGVSKDIEVDTLDELSTRLANGTISLGDLSGQNFIKTVEDAALAAGASATQAATLAQAMTKNTDAVIELTKQHAAQKKQEETKWVTAYMQRMANDTTFQQSKYKEALGYLAHDEASGQYKTEAEAEVDKLWKGKNEDFWDSYLTNVLGEESAANGTGENYRVVGLGGDAVELQKWNGTSWEDAGEIDETAANDALVNAIAASKADADVSAHAQELEGYEASMRGLGVSDAFMNQAITSYAQNNKDGIDVSNVHWSELLDITAGTLTALQQGSAFEQELAEGIRTAQNNLGVFGTQGFATWYKSLGGKDQRLLVGLDIDKNSTLQEVQEALHEAQVYANENQIKASITYGNDFNSFLSQGKRWEREFNTTTGKWEYKNLEDFYKYLMESGIVDESEMEYNETTGQMQLTTAAKAKYNTMTDAEISEKVAATKTNAIEEERQASDNSAKEVEKNKQEEQTKLNSLQHQKAQAQGQNVAANAALSSWIMSNQVLTNFTTGQTLAHNISTAGFTDQNMVKSVGDFQNYITNGNLASTFATSDLSGPEGAVVRAFLAANGIDQNAWNNANQQQRTAWLQSLEQDLSSGGLGSKYNTAFQILEAYEGSSAQIAATSSQISQLNTDIETSERNIAEMDTALAEYTMSRAEEEAHIQGLNNEYGISNEQYEAQVELLGDMVAAGTIQNKTLEKNETALRLMAQAQIRANQGAQTLISSWSNWKDEIESKDITRMAKAYGELGKTLTALFNATDGEVTQEFMATYFTEIQAAVEGTEEDMRRLIALYAQYRIFNSDKIISPSDKKQIEDYITQLGNTEIVFGATIDTSPVAQQLLQVLINAKYTKDEIEAIFDDMQWTVRLDDNYNIIASSYRGLQDIQAMAKDEAERVENEIERYHVINKTLERLNKEYEKITKLKEHAFGNKYLFYLDQEIAKTNELAEATKTKLGEAQMYLKKDRKEVLSFGASLDEYGNITNYEEIMRNNNASDEVKKAISQYEETLALVRDLDLELTDYFYQNLSQKLEGIEYRIDLRVRLNELDEKNIEFMMENLEDHADDAVKKFQLMGRSMANAVENADEYLAGITEILSLSGLEVENILTMNDEELQALLETTELTEEQVAQLESSVDDLMENVNALKELYSSVSDTLDAAFDKANEAMEDSIDKLQHMTDIAETFYNIIDLAGKEALGLDSKLLTNIRTTQFTVASDELRVQKAKLEQNIAYMEALQAELDAAQEEKETEKYNELKESYDKAAQVVQEDQKNYLNSLSSGLEAATALFKQQMDNTLADFEDAMTGVYGTFEGLQSAFDQQKEIDDRYLDDYEKIYELSKLNRDVLKSIDENDSIRAKERLRDLQEEINALQQSGVKATQFEVDALRAKYDLRVAEIALEEAQNAKSKVTMRRDSEGNWGYVYTADQANIDSAAQTLEDKLYAYQQKLQDYTDEMQARLIAIPQEYAEAVRAIYEDQTLNDEERYLRIMQLQDYYQGMYKYVVEQLGESLDQSQILLEEDWTNYSRMTGYKISKDKEWVSSFDETIASQVTGLGTLDEAQLTFEAQTGMVLSKLEEHYKEYRDNVKDTLEFAIGDIEAFFGDDSTSGTLAYYLDLMRQGAQSVADTAEDMGEKNARAFEQAVAAAAENLDDYGLLIDQWNNKTAEIGEIVATVISKYALLKDELKEIVGLQEKVSGSTNDKTLDYEIPLYLTASGAGGITTATLTTLNGWNDVKLETQNIDGEEKYYFSGRAPGASGSVGGYISRADYDYLSGFTGVSKGQSTYDYNDVEQGKDPNSTSVGYTQEEQDQLIGAAEAVASQREAAAAEEERKRKEEEERKRKEEEAKLKAKPTLTALVDWNTHSAHYESSDHTYFGTYFGHGVKGIEKDKSYTVKRVGIGGTGQGTMSTAVYAIITDTEKTNGKWNWVMIGTYNISDGFTPNNYAISDLDKQKMNSKLSSLRFDAIKDGKVKAAYFDTGGYTGSWDSSGRLAVLHQKELVLNAADTANFLSAVDILRDITSVLDLQAIAQSNGLSSLVSVPRVDATQAQLQQEVTIHAEFPNAVNHSEIEQAFSTLLNNASQFANRKNK